MKKYLAIFMMLVIVIVFFAGKTNVTRENTTSPLSQTFHNTQTTTTPIPQVEQTHYLFIPYWTMATNENVASYDNLIYFGITPNTDGIDKTDSGFTKLPRFIKLFSPSGAKLYLAVRMTNQDINSQVLKSQALQQKIIADTMQIAKANKFDGIVLDFEDSALSFDSVIQAISNFQKKFYAASKNNDLPLLTTIYGDNFYRLRPYDMKVIGQNSDELLIMTYDFSKAGGNPGPTFPYLGKNTYGYDFQTMTSDFEKNVPREKLIIVLGMFGYDWTVDNNNQPIGMAQPITLLQAQQKFLPVCQEANCKITRDNLSGEQTITYTDTNSKRHIVWFEDTTSAKQKSEYLKTQGIPGIGYWAYSYF